MILKVLFIQRKCSYDGQYAPEAMVCVDEYCYYENSTWFDNQVNKELELAKDDIFSHSIIDIEVNQDKVISILNDNSKISGEIK